MSERNVTTDITEMLSLSFDVEMFDEEEVKLEISKHVYDLRAAMGQTQAEFAAFVGIDKNVVADLEEWDYSGNFLAMLARIEESLYHHIDALPVPLQGVYPNVLLATTITGFKLRLFRHHPGRKTVAAAKWCYNAAESHPLPIDKQQILNEFAPWQYALEMNRQELKMFALAGVTAWCHLDGGLRINFSGEPLDYIRAGDTHAQLIDAISQYLHTGERTGFKQWRQEMEPLQYARYVTELETALNAEIYAEFPDAEWLAQTLIQFLKRDAAENEKI